MQAGIAFVQVPAQFGQKGMRFGQIFAAGAFALVQVRNGVQTESVDAHIGPEIERAHDGSADERAIEVQIGLMREEPMPVVSFRNRIEAPIRRFEILEDDPRAGVFVGRVAPDVEVAPAGTGFRSARLLKPLMLVGGVVDDKFRDDPQIPAVSFFQEILEIAQGAVGGMNLAEIRDVVTVVLPGGREERQQPDCGYAKILKVIQLFRQAPEVTHSVCIAVVESAYVRFVNNGVFVPEGIILANGQSVRRLHARFACSN